MGFTREHKLKYVANDPKAGMTLDEIERFVVQARAHHWLPTSAPKPHVGHDADGRTVLVGLELHASTAEEER